ncbi:hypothetical protein TSAR_015480, partial [Trichomalopsis sarcophagae]
LKDLKGVSTTTSLAELGMDSMMSVEIKQTLEREFEIFLTAQDIRSLNFSKLQEMCAKQEESDTKKESHNEVESVVGLKMLIQVIGHGDVNPEMILRLPSKGETDREEVFLIPGIEGVGSVFLNLASKIKAPATCLQLGIGNDEMSIFDMANKLLPHVLNRNKNRRHFVVAGYSYGASVAIELMRQLEAKGLDGRLILIDGAPQHLKTIIDEHLQSKSKEELQNSVLLGVLNMLVPSKTSELSVELEKSTSWENKLENFIKHIPTDKFDMSVEHQKALCTAVYKRLLAAQSHDISTLSPIRASITLIKPTLASVRNASEDYGLSKVTNNTVEIYHVNGNHVTMLDNEKVAAAINGDAVEDAESFKAEIMKK